MFGLLDLKSCELRRDAKRYYSCNVCNAIALNYGCLSRLLLSNDAIFLSILTASQKKELTYSLSDIKCKPWTKKTYTSPDFDFPAAVSIFISGVSLLDEINDNKSLRAKFLYTFYQKRINEAKKKIHNFDLYIPDIVDIVKQQHRREAIINKNIDYYSFLTEDMYSTFFSHTAKLSGLTSNYIPLTKIGRNIGHLAYLLDNYMDIELDKKNGVFNIFIKDNDNLPLFDLKYKAKKVVKCHLKQCLKMIQKNFSKIQLYHFQEKIKYIIKDGVQAQVQRVLSNNHMLARPTTYFALTPLIFGFLQSNIVGDSFCPWEACGCESLGLCSYSGADVTEHIAVSAAGGAVGAAIGVGGSNIVIQGLTRSATSNNGELPEELPEDDLQIESEEVTLPETPPENPFEPSITPQTRVNASDIRQNLGIPSDFPIMPGEVTISNWSDEEPARRAIKETVKQDIIKDVKAEEDRKQRNLSLEQEGEEIWRERPAIIDNYYRSIGVEFYSKGGIPERLSGDLRDDLSSSENPKERQWWEKWRSWRRRNVRFNKLRLQEGTARYLSSDAARELGVICGSGG